ELPQDNLVTPRPGLDDLLHLQPDFAQVHIQVLQHVGRDARALLDEAEEDVLGADVLVVEALRLLVGELHHLASPVRESFVHLRTSPAIGARPGPRGRAGGRPPKGWSVLAAQRFGTVRESFTPSYAAGRRADNAGRPGRGPGLINLDVGRVGSQRCGTKGS